MVKTTIVFYLVLSSFREGAVVIPEPYANKQQCIDAATDMKRDYDNSESNSNIAELSYTCIGVPREGRK